MTIDESLSQIASFRETKGQETETLKLISELESKTIDPVVLTKLFWEKAFVYQHLVMSKTDSELNLKLMEESALNAHKLVEQNNLVDLRGDDFRFLGRLADYSQKYSEAYDYYQQALEFFTVANSPRVLEIKGFLSANLVNQGRIEEGLNFAKETYQEFDESPLKEVDNYTWVTWKTGIFPRLVTALIKQEAEFDHEEIKKYLEASRTLFPNQFRLDEINEALGQL